MGKNLTLGELTAKPGEKVSGWLHIADSGLEIPVSLICGMQDGPTVLVTGGIHNAEYVGIQAAIELREELKPSQMRGKVILFPLVNRTGFEHRTMSMVYEDGKNINREFPGDPSGTLTEQICHTFVDKVFPRVDYYIDLHCGDGYEELYPHVYTLGAASPKVNQASDAMARAVNVKFRYPSQNPSGGSYNQAGSMGVPGILLERGGRSVWSREEVERWIFPHCRAYRNMVSLSSCRRPHQKRRASGRDQRLYGKYSGGILCGSKRYPAYPDCQSECVEGRGCAFLLRVERAGKQFLKMKKKSELTKGSIGKQLLLFALPLLGTSLIQQLYNTVDLFFVGNFLGTQATAAVGASSLLTNCMVGFFTGLSLGTGVIISISVGENNKKRIHKVIHTAMGLSLAGGAVLTLLGLALSRQILLWMNTPLEILEQSLLYIRIYLLGMTPLFVYNMNAGVIRARGDSRTPMVFQLTGALINILLDWISLAHFGMGVEGAAWATFLSQLAAAAGTVVYLIRRSDEYRLNWKKIGISRDILRSVMKIGVPAGCQNMVITLSNIFVQTAINSLGVSVIAAFTAYFKVECLIYLPIVAFGQAATTFVGQNFGAGEKTRIQKGVINCIVMGCAYAVIMAMLLIWQGKAVLGLFTSDDSVIALGIRIIRVTFPFYWLYVLLEVHADALRGIGRSIPPMALILICICGLRTVLLLVFNRLFGSLEAVAAVYPCAWLAAAVCLTACWVKIRKHL